MIPIVQLAQMLKQASELMNENDMNEQEQAAESKKDKKKQIKRKAVADFLNSELAAIEKTQNLLEAHSALMAVHTASLTPAGQSAINSALVTVAGEMEAHQATGETDQLEQVNAATAIAEMALRRAQEIEKQAEHEKKKHKEEEEEQQAKLNKEHHAIDDLLIQTGVRMIVQPVVQAYEHAQTVENDPDELYGQQVEPLGPDEKEVLAGSNNLQQMMKQKVRANHAGPTPYDPPQEEEKKKTPSYKNPFITDAKPDPYKK